VLCVPPAQTASVVAAFKALTVLLTISPAGKSEVCRPRRLPSQSSSASRLTAGAAGFLDLQPVIDPTGAVGRAEALRHDALAAERAGVLEENRAVADKCWLKAMPSWSP
jgi:hypothetical protein